MASDLIGVTSYKLSISIDATATPPPPPPSAGAGDRFFSISAWYLHVAPHRLLRRLHRKLLLPRDDFLAVGPEAIRLLLSACMGVRALPDDVVASFAPAMSRFAADADAAPWAAVVSVLMTVTAETLLPPANIDRALRESVRTAPARESCVDALEVVATIEAQDRCSICLEDFVSAHGLDQDHHHHGDRDRDRTVVKMPCSHMYHRACIVKWLEKSRLCPMCRCAIPISSSPRF